MCLIVAACNAHPRYEFVLAANRDEYCPGERSNDAAWEEETYKHSQQIEVQNSYIFKL